MGYATFTTTLAPSAETPVSSQVTLPPALTTPATVASETSSVHHIRFCYTTFMHAASPCPPCSSRTFSCYLSLFLQKPVQTSLL